MALCTARGLGQGGNKVRQTPKLHLFFLSFQATVGTFSCCTSARKRKWYGECALIPFAVWKEGANLLVPTKRTREAPAAVRGGR